jgi:hypothetical protein
LLGCVSFAGDPIGYARFLGLVSFDCHPGSPLFSHQRHTLLLLVSVFSFRHLSLSLLRRSLPFRQQHLLSLLRRSLARSLCSLVPASLPHSPPPATHALRIVLSLLRKPTLQPVVGRPAACAMAKEASERRPRCHQSRRLCVPSHYGSAPSSALSPRPQRRLRSSSSAALCS